jgi:hypothetical protein
VKRLQLAAENEVLQLRRGCRSQMSSLEAGLPIYAQIQEVDRNAERGQCVGVLGENVCLMLSVV